MSKRRAPALQQPLRRHALAAATAALLAGAAQPASAATCTWNTASGNWNALANWLNCVAGNGNPGGVPGGADTAVIGAGSTVTVSTAQAINTLNNAGVVSVNNNTALSFDARTTGASFFGGGQIVLGGSGSRLYVEGGNGVTVGAGSTIRGAGQIGQAVVQSGGSLFSNAGTISADANGQALILVAPGNSGSYANTGLMEARNGGTLELRNVGVAQSGGGQVRAEAGSSVLINGATVAGGVVGTTGNGRIQASGNFNNLLSGVTLAGVVDMVPAGSSLRIQDGLSFSNGTIDVGSSSILYIDNRGNLTQTLGGTGTINLAGGALRMEGSGQTTTGANVTIRGSGTVGQATVQSGNHTWINNGLVSADVSGQTLNLVSPGNGPVPIQNNGILEAMNGGRLLLSADVDAATGSQMRAGAGSVIEMNGVRVTGTVNTTGSGSFRANASFNNVLSGVTLNGNLDMASGAASTRISEGLVLNGAINVGSSSILYLDNRSTATQAVSGTGSINLAGGALRMEGTGQTTTGANIAIRGSGTVGQATVLSGQHTWVNNGLVSADVSGQTLNLVNPGNGSQPVQHNGTMQATGGGTLQISTDVTGGAASRYDVDAASRVLMNGVTLSGVVNQTGSGAIDTSASLNNLLSAASLSGRVNVSSLRVSNGMAMNGGATVNVGASGVLYFDNRAPATAAQTISGNGQIVMAGGALRFEGGTSTTWDSGVTVRGSGQIGQATLASANHTLVNNGTIMADGGALNITPIANAGSLQGTGTLRVDGGALSLGTGQTTNQGTLDMRATGTLALGAQNLVLSSDYTNAQAGSGNSFNRRAGVSGTGQIQAGGDGAQMLSGAGVTGGTTSNATLTIGNVRVGANTFNVNIGNGGTTGPLLRGALQTSVNGANITDARLSGSGVTAGNYNAGGPGGGGETRAITFTASSAGALAPMSGQVVNLRSTYDNIADQKLNIVLGSGAAAYNAALGFTSTPVQVANQRVGGSNSATLVVNNTAAAGAFSEDLNASIASVGGQATATGSVSGRLAGTSNTGTGAITARVDTSSAGAKSGVVNLNYESAGAVNGVSNGLGTVGVGGQTVTVNGNVYQAASGALQTAALNFGTVQVGQAVSQSLVVRNTATGATGFVEDLNASFGAASGTGAGLISGSGSLSGILAGSNSNAGNGSMVVNVNTSAAGVINGSIAVNYTSAGAVAGVSNGLGLLAVGSEAYGVAGTIQATGNVINQASPLVNNPTVNLGAVRVGAAAPTGTVSVTNVATAAPQAALNASIAPTTGPVSASGNFSLLNPGATNNTSLVVGLNTGTAGNFTGVNAGTATISFVSDAANVGNCAPNCQLNLASQVVNVEGKVYTQAVGSASGTVINFGVVRVGDTVSARNITIDNTAAATALNDTLRADLSGLAGPFGGNGSVSGISAQGSGQIGVGLNTASAGIFNSTGSIGFTSQNADMADVSAGANASVSVMATVNNLANGDFDLAGGSGTLSQAGSSYTLDLGTIVLGDSVSSTLTLDNDVAGPADELSGSFDLGAADDFTYGGWGPLSMLVAGASSGNLTLQWLAGSLGLFTDTIVFNGLGTNASDTTGLAQTRTLTIRANVISGTTPPGNVPEPGTLALLLAAAAAGLAARRNVRAAA
jgi:hypothetical protein